MTKFNDYVKETGFAQPTLEKLLKAKFEPAVAEILEIASSESEVRVLSSILSNRVGKMASDEIITANTRTKGSKLEKAFTEAVEKAVEGLIKTGVAKIVETENGGKMAVPVSQLETFVDPNVKPEEIRDAMGVEEPRIASNKNQWIDPFELIFDKE